MAIAVIGMGYGDEGKGAIVDCLARRNTTVVRYNGGAQAGHTVVADGRRHVFHHLGAGSFRGARTHLSQYFVANPLLFVEEVNELGFVPAVSIDLRAPITTPVEMMINQALESSRSRRHGSCGLGFGETWEREVGVFSLTVDSACSLSFDRFMEQCFEWAKVRCDHLGLDRFKLPLSKEILVRFWGELRWFLSHVSFLPDESLSGDVVFEGAQGLGLDQDIGHFPHVTRSHTGLKNIQSIVNNSALAQEPLDVVYATRSYATRHGAGPLSMEQDWCHGVFDDETNFSNPWQQSLRFAQLDFAERNAWIAQDGGRDSERVGVAISCLDQYGQDPDVLAARFELPLWMTAYGPDREDRTFFGNLKNRS